MKTGRNDPCPCGSGKKYKKCCLAGDESAARTRAIASQLAPSAVSSPEADSSRRKLRESDLSRALARAVRAKEPPPPTPALDPEEERAKNLWREFKSQSEERQAALFLDSLQDESLIADETAFEMLNCLRSAALGRGDDSRFSELVAALRERRPEVYEQSAAYYLSWLVLDALAENRLEGLASLTGDLAARAGKNIDVFNRTTEALAYHGQLSVLVEAYRIAWPGVKSSKDIVPWFVSEFVNTSVAHEIYDYQEHAGSPDPADPGLHRHIRFYAEDPREGYVPEFISDLPGTTGRKWQADDFALRPPRKRARDEWDDPEEPRTPDPAEISLSRLMNEFVGYMRREEGVPFPRGHLVGDHLHSYFVQRHRGELDPRPSMLDQMYHPDLKLPKPPPPAHPLCPERVTLDCFLGQKIGHLVVQSHVVAAVFQAMPAWVRFLERQGLIDADVRRRVGSELLPLHATFSKLWQSYHEDPTLYREEQLWPADVAKEPAESSR